MKFSLILPTINRPKEIYECLNSLENQNFRNFEVIIIDQSDNDETRNIICEIKKNTVLNINYNKVKFKALSKARNYGIRLSLGEYIVLLDDDARYNEAYLKNADKLLSKFNNRNIILSGIIIDDTINEKFVDYNIANDEEILTIKKIMKICLSASIIINKKMLIRNDFFDERFGIGAEFGAAEESDLILRCVKEGAIVVHTKSMEVYHLKPKLVYDNNMINKAYNYALGGGALIKKHVIYNKNYKLISKSLRFVVAPLIKMIFNIQNKNKFKYYYNILKGHILGFLIYKEI